MDIQGPSPVATSTLHHVPEWGRLSPSDTVEVYRQGQALAAGQVDTLTPDGRVLWIFREHGQGRVMFLKSDGVDIFQRTT